MKQPIAITINREFGSGGRLVGEKLAEALGMKFVDRLILTEAAKLMGVTEEHLKGFDEKAPSIWQTSSINMGSYHGMAVPCYFYSLTNNDLYVTQVNLIEKMAKESSCVFIGRCANVVLEDHPQKLSIFLHADKEFKKAMIRDVYHFTKADNIEKEMKRVDKERSNYYSNYTGFKWHDATQYDLTIDTGELGIDHTVKLIQTYIQMKFGE
ncbi:cytidylate kinase-like family protein [Niameybacter massiliensis]|uniref:Cytidylate kinase-like family protein n=1 Tax=Holtiella tumoricola TaxID=3018743 RepID=A0AA42J1U0_9FIRM|nr:MULTISPECIES: cytidylate kinase-like family protein [Lachnospirales]MDA3732889.1 cytidylate kinase-like family protein [Holtiella tumoricola]